MDTSLAADEIRRSMVTTLFHALGSPACAMLGGLPETTIPNGRSKDWNLFMNNIGVVLGSFIEGLQKENQRLKEIEAMHQIFAGQYGRWVRAEELEQAEAEVQRLSEENRQERQWNSQLERIAQQTIQALQRQGTRWERESEELQKKIAELNAIVVRQQQLLLEYQKGKAGKGG